MKKIWLLFSQCVTLFLAAWFVVATLKPELLNRGVKAGSGLVPTIEAPAANMIAAPAGSLRVAAQKASAAVVSISVSKAAAKNPNANDPWFKFFFGDRGQEPQGGLGSGVIVSPSGIF